jgi:hypothetical protein
VQQPGRRGVGPPEPAGGFGQRVPVQVVEDDRLPLGVREPGQGIS